MSEKNLKNFSSQFKAKVALEAIRGIKTANEIAECAIKQYYVQNGALT